MSASSAGVRSQKLADGSELPSSTLELLSLFLVLFGLPRHELLHVVPTPLSDLFSECLLRIFRLPLHSGVHRLLHGFSGRGTR
jgi:hypothetical protein